MGGHFGRDKTIALVEDRFFWPSLKKDVWKVIKQCRAFLLYLFLSINKSLCRFQ